MFPPSIFEDRCVDLRRSMCRLSKNDVSNLRRSMCTCRPSKIDDRCVDLRRSLCRPSKNVDRCVDLRRSMVGVSTFADRWSMRRSTFGNRCEIMLQHLLKTLILWLYANCAESLHFSAFIIMFVYTTLIIFLTYSVLRLSTCTCR